MHNHVMHYMIRMRVLVLLFLGHGQYVGSEDSNVLHCIYRAWFMIQVV